MKINKGFKAWNSPYLFQEMEDIIASFSQEARREIISLGIGDPDLPTPAGIRSAMQTEHRNCYHGYPSVQGRQDLREAIAAYYRSRFNVKLSPDEILIGLGAKTDLFDLCTVFANPGDYAALLDPAYPVYCDSLSYRGQNIHFLPGTDANGYMPELDVSKMANGDLALIYMCYPNNPTGAMATPDYLQTMIGHAKNLGAMVVFDIAYADFTPGNLDSRAFSIFSLPGSEATGIEIGSFSKPFSMTGDRISWVVIRNPEAREYWKRYRSNRDSGASNYDQAGALAALTRDDVKAQVRENMDIYGKRVKTLMDGLTALGWPCSGLDNTPYAWIRSPIPDSREVAGRILKEARVMVTPGVGFGPGGEGYIRATIFQPENRLAEAVERIGAMDFRV